MSQAHPLTCTFEPQDTWFFREARPHGSVGSSELGSVFPPPVRTLLGALRTLIGDAWFARHGGNWRGFRNNADLQAIIGFGDDLGLLCATGPFLCRHGQRLYPAPANLMAREQGGQVHHFLLDLAAPVHCDLGYVHLPGFPAQVAGLPDLAGSKPAEDCWLTEQGLHAVLSGRAPAASDVLHASQLFAEEPRLGIGRDNQRSAVQEGLLYQTRHLRLQTGVSVQLQLHGLQDASLLPTQTTVRLGGEGRMAGLHVETAPAAPLPQPAGNKQAAALALYALTPMLCDDELPAGIPAGFTPAQHAGADVWEGHLGELPIRILAVACGRPLREGGWDMARHRARAVHSLLTPGSVLYVQGTNGATPNSQALQSALATLPDACGRGLFAAGRLPTSTTFQG